MHLSLTTFGRIRCLLGTEELTELPHQRSRCALLIYLAIEREASRESLYNLFWSDRDDEKARGALKQTLYELRRQLGTEWIDATPDPMSVSALVRTDAADFEAAVKAGHPGAALALYRGDFLREFSLPNCKEFEFWVDRKRAHYARLHRTIRRGRIAELTQAGKVPEAILVAREWVELEPDEDEAQHKLIELLVSTGQRADALRQYESYERLLAADQLQPLEQTVALVTALRAATDDDQASVALVGASTSTSQSTSVASIGRPDTTAPVRRARWSTRRIGAVTASTLVFVALSALLTNVIRDDASDIRSLVILPFEHLGPESDSTYWLSEGLSDELMTALERIEGLRVAPRTSAFASKLRGLRPDSITRLLNVDGRVEATFRFEGDTIRVAASLIDGKTGLQLWNGTFRAGRSSTEPVQDQVARAIATELRLRLGPDANRSRRLPNDHARQLYWQGRYFLSRRAPDSTAKALDYFDAAVAIDSTFAQAYSGLADAYALAALFNYVPQNEAYAKAKTAALRAIQLEPNLVDAHVSLGRALHYTDWDLEGAEKEFKKALKLDPNSGLAHSWYGVFLNLAFHNRTDQALRYLVAGATLEPYNAPLLSNLGRGYLLHARYADAKQVLLQALAITDWHNPHLHLGNAYLGLGEYKNALREFRVGATLTGNAQRSNDFIAGAGEALAHLGQKDSAEAILGTLELAWKDRTVRPDALCALLLALDQSERCIEVVEQAIREAWPEGTGSQINSVSGRGVRMLRQAVNALLSDPVFKAIRSDARIVRVRREHGLFP